MSNYMHSYYLQHKEHHLANCRAWYQQHKRQAIQLASDWQREHRDRHNAISQKYWHNLKVKVLTHYSNDKVPKCVQCNESRIECLSIDHINGHGNRHRKEIGSSLYTWLIHNSYPSGYQTLCMNCQFIKKHTKDANV